MKKPAYLLLILTICLFWQCKKDRADEEVTPQPEITNPDDANKILKKLVVSEAETVTFDSLRAVFLVKLPASFSADDINISLSLYPDVYLLDSASSETNNNNLKFSYKGSRPLNLVFRKKGVSTTRRYELYVEAQGSPKIELSTKEISVKQGVSYIPLKIISGLGTIPSIPEQRSPIIKLSDRATNTVFEGTFQNVLQNVYFEDLTSLINAEKVGLELTFEGISPLNFEGLQLKRGVPRADLNNMPYTLVKSDTLKITGGYFDPNAKYTAGLSNDFSTTPLMMDLAYDGKANLSAKFTTQLSEGSYLVTFYENGKEMGKGAFEYSSSKSNTLETIWKGDINLVFKRNTQSLAFNRGDEFYAKPSLAQYAWGSNLPTSSFDVKQLPNLRLVNGSSIVNLAPEIAVVSWAIAGVSYAVGKYKLPENLASGSYAVTALYPNQPESKPYWSKMQVR